MNGPAGLAPQEIGERRDEMLVHPVSDPLIARAQAEHAVRQAVELHASEPLLKARRLAPRERESSVPYVV